MSKPFSRLLEGMSPRARAEIESQKRRLLRQHPLAYIRNAIGLLQSQVADLLGVSQAAVSKLESRSDFLLSTLKAFCDATGGSLSIKIVYPSHTFSLAGMEDDNGRSQFSIKDEPKLTRYDQQHYGWTSAKTINSTTPRARVVTAANHDNYAEYLCETA